MSTLFDIKEHVIDTQHIREYARATAHSQEEVLQLAVKQYTPKDNPNPKPGDITVIASHANGFVKELYEPLWEDLLHSCRQNGVNIRGIWIADIAWQGQSGVLNEDKLGNDPSWLDHARDLLHLTNVFRSQMPRPIVGIAHSFGGNIIVNLSLIHPRLFSALVMIDPVLTRNHKVGPLYGFATMRASSTRRDLWPSREDAERSIRRNKFYSAWDPRAVDRLVKFGFRECPTRLYPDKKSGEVTLTSTKHMECFTYYRPTHLGPRDPKTGKRTFDRSLIPDATDDVDNYPNFPFYQPPTPAAAGRLPELRPSVLWVAGETSDVCPPETRKEKMELTGYGAGGSGGAKAGRVKELVVEGTGHLVAMEKPGVVASNAAGFIRGEVDRWRKEEEAYRQWADNVDDRMKSVMDDEFLALIKSVGPEANKRRDGSLNEVKPKL
ncbi:Peroxisomal membrane protein LPX1 [Cytospora mali]|uniref:Peroxisomal membrane protein LPX1 n=1 Tax=Cytospora mali TaxID=578113 RepID=A0A194UMU7_CYTMA|nr:Peroxisomal membrane protein LPX1 [Valsa mali var. pyri (nom. inval.)]